MTRRRLLATPLAAWERDGLKTALLKAGLPADDVDDARLLFWRFETVEVSRSASAGLKFMAAMRSCVRW
jgi:hypothetical protein